MLDMTDILIIVLIGILFVAVSAFLAHNMSEGNK